MEYFSVILYKGEVKRALKACQSLHRSGDSELGKITRFKFDGKSLEVARLSCNCGEENCTLPVDQRPRFCRRNYAS